MKELFIITDYDGLFLISMADLKHYTTMDVERIKEIFVNEGFVVNVVAFSDIDLTKDYSGKYIIYQTSEEKGIFYKHYIEDVIYFLESRGAIVLPRSDYLRAHHNKAYMEFLRLSLRDECLKSVTSLVYGSEIEAAHYNGNFPVVIKKTAGSGSSGVYLAKNEQEYKKYIKIASMARKEYSRYGRFKDVTKKIAKPLFSHFFGERLFKTVVPIYKPIVVQTFIKNLPGDYKILVFGDKFYSLYRKNRDNDFRASGSGKLFEVLEEEQESLLDFAKKLTLEIDWPIIGMDIGFDGKQYHLFEFQMLHIGPYALQASRFWHEYRNGKWMRYEGKSDLEEEYCRSICLYIEKIKTNDT